MLRLRSYDRSPPGGYFFIQREGKYREFPSQPLIEAQARIVSDFRTLNQFPRASIAECIEDISVFTCQRLGGMAQYCVDADAPASAPPHQFAAASPCRGCGAKVNG